MVAPSLVAPLLEAEGLRLERGGRTLFEGIGLTVRPGEKVAVTAPPRTIRLSVELLDRVMSGVSDMVLARNELARRLRDSEAIINRMGFNNAGAAALADRLKALGPIGVPSSARRSAQLVIAASGSNGPHG